MLLLDTESEMWYHLLCTTLHIDFFKLGKEKTTFGFQRMDDH